VAQDPSRHRTLILLSLVVLAPSVGSLAGLWIWPGPFGSGVYGLCKTVLYGVPAVVALRTLTRADIVVAARRGSPHLSFALVAGLAAAGLTMAVWFGGLAAHSDTSKLVAVTTENELHEPLRYWIFAGWLCVVNSLLEEFVFRWFVDSRLRLLGLGSRILPPVSAAIFSLHHVIVLSAFFDAPLVVLGSLGVFGGGLTWSWMLARSGSIVPGWIMHGLVDLAIMVIGASVLGFGI